MTRIVFENVKNVYTTGASSDGYAIASIAGSIGFIALIVFLSVRSSKNEGKCLVTAQRTQCGW